MNYVNANIKSAASIYLLRTTYNCIKIMTLSFCSPSIYAFVILLLPRIKWSVCSNTSAASKEPLETATLQSHTKLCLLGAAVFNGK